MDVNNIKIIRKELLDKEITVCMQCLDHGVQVSITGGDLSHIGAVSIVDEKGELSTTLFPGHKDHVISDTWAKKLFEACSVPVVVVAGIHYDHVGKKEISAILSATDEMLREILKYK